MRQKPINDGTISGLRVPKCDKFTKFPVKFPVSRENRQSRGPPALRRQPSSPVSSVFYFNVARKAAVGWHVAVRVRALSA